MSAKTGLDIRRMGAVCALIAAFAVSSPAQTRIVAIGDVHGAFSEFVAILQKVGLIDANRRWTGGSSILVQTGDVVDRGPESRQALDLLMELQEAAAKQNGQVVPLLGNHEVMNLTGDLRYTSVEDYGTFATEQSEKVREKAYRAYREFLSAHGGNSHPTGPDDEAVRQKWMAEHPLGFFERRDAFGPKGVYGRWIRKHDAVVQIGEVIFLHGGLSPALDFRNLKQLNERVHSEIADFDAIWELLSEKNVIWRYMTQEEALRQVQTEWRTIQLRGQVEDPEAARDMQALLGLPNWLIFSPNGPLWYRGLALEPEQNLQGKVEAMLARLKAKYIVAGHTVRPKSEIMPRFDKRVFLIDTGMLRQVYAGRASALEIQNGRFTAYYSDGERQVLVSPDAATVPGSAGHDGKGEEHP
jgi:calcineurin-like phosphoesterase family protein